jgi:hypothetical protein
MRVDSVPYNGTIGLFDWRYPVARNRDYKRQRLRVSERPVKPEMQNDALTDAGRDVFMEGEQQGGDATRTRIPMQNTGTWSDTVYPGCTHTTDPKAPKVNKAL